MDHKLSKKEILEIIREDVKDELTDEEILRLIIEKKVTKKASGKEKYTFGQKAADAMARFAGSWKFVLGFLGFLVVWIIINHALGTVALDPFPFILLNLLLSCVAAVQAPLIMMSQNRQEEKDRERAANDYKVNLKTEIIIEDLYGKLSEILSTQRKIQRTLKMLTAEQNNGKEGLQELSRGE